MTTLIIDSWGHKRSEGKNLGIMFRYAKKRGGVKRLEVTELEDQEARVVCFYLGGWKAVTTFSSFSHACDWARARSALPGRSWFSGCEVLIHHKEKP